MEPDLRVNAKYFEAHPTRFEVPGGGGSAAAAPNPDYGPCLYLGPSGERCDLRALEGGFCALHEPGVKRPAINSPATKRIAAVVAALAALLPWLTDLIREIIRLLR